MCRAVHPVRADLILTCVGATGAVVVALVVRGRMAQERTTFAFINCHMPRNVLCSRRHQPQPAPLAMHLQHITPICFVQPMQASSSLRLLTVFACRRTLWATSSA